MVWEQGADKSKYGGSHSVQQKLQLRAWVAFKNYQLECI